MRYCGSVDTVPAYQRVKKQPQSPEHFNNRPIKANNYVQDKKTRKNSPSSHHTIAQITYKMQMNSDDEQAEAMEEVESLGKCLSYSPDAPKALGIASKRRVNSSMSSCKKGSHNKESLNSSMEPHNNTSIANLLVRYQSIVELSTSSSSSSSSSTSSSSSSSSSASPSTNSPHNNLILV